MRHSLLHICLALLALSAFGAKPKLNTCEIFADRIASTHRLKATFEGGVVPYGNSVASLFPDFYSKVIQLFKDRPSYVMALNKGLPPVPGVPFAQLITNIHHYGWEIGAVLRYFIDGLPRDYYGLEFLYYYADKFQAPISSMVKRTYSFDSESRDQIDHLSQYGSNAVSSLWGELRTTMLLENVSRVGATVEELMEQGVLTRDTFLQQYYRREIDHLWFPGGGQRPKAVAIGETKVLESPFNDGYPNKKTIFEQFEVRLNIASRAGAQLGLPAEVQYFFIAGINNHQIDRMQQMTRDFNRKLKGVDPSFRVPVKLIIHGSYE